MAVNPLVCSGPTASGRAARAAPSAEALYREHAEQVARCARRLGGPGVDADDIVQQVFVRVQKKLGSLREDANVAAWLFRITQNEVRQVRRRERLRTWWSRADAQPDEAEATPETDLARKQDAQQVYAILDRMGEKYRSVLILFQLEGLSGEEIAALTGLRLGTVWVRLHRARARFLALMAELDAGGGS